MGTRYVRATGGLGAGLGAVGTSTYIMIATNVATQILLDSGYQAISLFNVGSGQLIWGDSNISVNSGNALFVSQRVEWSPVQDGWSVYLIANSVQALVAKVQYNA